jgi:Sigma-54 interaction domain
MHQAAHDVEATQDLAIVCASGAHALLVGPDYAIDMALATLQRGLRQPVVSWTPTEIPEPPALTAGTLVVRNLAGLAGEQQRQLLEWVDNRQRKVQVISTSGQREVWPLVERGAFLTPLYYRLGVVCVDLTGAPNV